ncbi:selenoneine synthase SenA [Variovorax sp. PCZ-1]|uniref:selenoneine synthase SenA n=1 Tax=Variovorax sp. PCZ-1 TaxID=2835533 RepID=UPI001BCE06C8|nr:selenoneine synthase SenA [Variovorax sp. PCZ-1]MBS7807467.1 SUMF1/EgtB/PvdO family nonheme iron enzyme [Variovorax sp. PCZ-1]
MIRTSDAATLSKELVRVRGITLALFEAYEAAKALDVPQGDEFNPPLWELGHIGWFQQWWIGRNQQRHMGTACDPEHARLPCPHLQAAHHGDDWYNSSTVHHARRWELPLLDSQAAKAYLQATLAQTLQCLNQAGKSDDDLYFYRLVLLHEAMHIEAAVYMAQALQQRIELPAGSIDTINSIAFRADSMPAISRFSIKNTSWKLGSPEVGFSFDNELSGQTAKLAAFEIDAKPVRWEQYLEFVQATQHALPRYLRKASAGYENLQFGQWLALDLQTSAVHLSWHDAQAYCLWAGRRLPSEAEWEYAAISESSFAWGDVWEWTSSDFQPYDGFQAHPYRDYSEPWFGSRKVLRGACAATLPIMRNPRYRNYFTPERTDIYAGFRTCAL